MIIVTGTPTWWDLPRNPIDTMIRIHYYEEMDSVEDEIYAAKLSGYSVRAIENVGNGVMESCDPETYSSYEFMQVDTEKKTVLFVGL